MRYYDIKIWSPGANISTATPLREYTSYPKVGTSNQNDPGALNVVLDIYSQTSAAQVQQGIVQIWGVALSDLLQANNFTNCQIQVYAGFQKGLPLNNQNQAGLVLGGVIFQAFGNWQGTDMTLDFVVVTNGSLASQNSNLVLNWLAGTQLAVPIKNAMQIAFPGRSVYVDISPNLVVNYDVVGVYSSLPAMAQAIKDFTASIIGGSYTGVEILTLPSGDISIFDSTKTSTAISIAFQDLIGQPTWIDVLKMQFVCPMRADLAIGDKVTMPQGLLGGSNGYGAPGAVTTTAASLPLARQQSAFKGNFVLTDSIHHMGNYRQPDGQSWVTVFTATGVAS